MRVVSTVHKAGFDQYGQDWVDGAQNWPAGTEFILYTEGFDLQNDRIDCRRIESVERADAFKRRFRHYRPIAWRWDVVKFCNKVFAAYDALYDYTGKAVWLDADAITYAQLPEGYVESLLPNGCYLSAFKRIGWATETGFWVMDCGHPRHKQFMDTWLRWFEENQFKSLLQWCDAATLDATVRIFERDGMIRTHSLSAGHEKHEHPMSQVDLARYIDHRKGKSRKLSGASPENEYRSAA